MNWLKQNPFVATLIAVCVILGGALGFFVFEAYSSWSDANDAYGSAVDKLHKLQSKVPFPSAVNLKKLQDQQQAYEAEIAAYQDELSKMELPLHMDVKPQQFQDDLRTDVNAVRSKADANGVKLPVNFYLGFEPYQSQLPSDKAAPYLDRQLRAILLVVNHLLDFKVQSIDDLQRQPLPEEGVTAASTPDNQGGPGGRRGGGHGNHGGSGGGSGGHTSPDVFSSSSFTISFTADQGKLRVAFDSLLNADQFFVIKTLTIENTTPMGPSKGNATGGEGAAHPAAQPKSKDEMSVILGREKVRAALQIQIVDFPAKPETKTN